MRREDESSLLVLNHILLLEQKLTSLAQSCLTLCDPMDYNVTGSSVQGILQARILEWVAISFSRGASQSRDLAHISCISCISRWALYHCTT